MRLLWLVFVTILSAGAMAQSANLSHDRLNEVCGSSMSSDEIEALIKSDKLAGKFVWADTPAVIASRIILALREPRVLINSFRAAYGGGKVSLDQRASGVLSEQINAGIADNTCSSLVRHFWRSMAAQYVLYAAVDEGLEGALALVSRNVVTNKYKRVYKVWQFGGPFERSFSKDEEVLLRSCSVGRDIRGFEGKNPREFGAALRQKISETTDVVLSDLSMGDIYLRAMQGFFSEQGSVSCAQVTQFNDRLVTGLDNANRRIVKAHFDLGYDLFPKSNARFQ